jgi:twitching motility protein PilT
VKGAGVETSGYSGGFVPGPNPVPTQDESAPPLSPLDAAWQPPHPTEAQLPPAPFPAPHATPEASSIALVPLDDITPSEAASMFGLPDAAAVFTPDVTPAQPAIVPAAMAEPVLAAEPVAAVVPLLEPVVAPEPLAVAPAWIEPPLETVEPPAAPTVSIAQTEAFEGAYHRGSTEEDSQEGDLNLHELLGLVLERSASDLHLTSGSRPQLRLNGHLTPLEDYPELTPAIIQRAMYATITQRQREKFEDQLELDFAYSVPGKARFRVNLYRQRDSVGAAFRLIPFELKKLEDLGIPPSVANFAMLPRGFVLVTGPTGSGKSTTLASLVDLANRQRRDHIMTVEDPIEFLHNHQSCIVNQREVGEDTHSFANALKHVLRQDPDIILVGEMRDLETISVALTAAETGHLVFATLHTQDAAQTIDRIIDVFPPHQQQQVRVQLAGSLQGVVAQTLARTVDGRGRVVATEVLVATPAIRNLVREGKTHQIYSAMQAGSQHGMHTMDQHLADLVKRGRITYETGLEKCHHIEDFNRLTGRG